MSVSLGLFICTGLVSQICHATNVSLPDGLLELNLSCVQGLGKSMSFLCQRLLVIFLISNFSFFLTTDSSIWGNGVLRYNISQLLLTMKMTMRHKQKSLDGVFRE